MNAPNRLTLRAFISLGALCFISLAASRSQDIEHPSSGYLETKLRTGLDAGHTKVGEAFQAESLMSWKIGDCNVSKGARIYGYVVLATRHRKSSPESTLALRFESIDCDDHPHYPIALHILEVIEPDLQRNVLFEAMPRNGQYAGGVVDEATAGALKQGKDSSVRIGSIIGEDQMQLKIAAGPQFAEVLRSSKRTVSLLTGTHLILGTKDMIPADQQLHFQTADK